MRGVSKIGQLLLQRYAAQLRHHTLLILCDNQGTVSNFNKMGAGSLAAFQLVRDLYEAAMAADVQLQFQWRPREDPAIAAADALTHEVDSADFRLCKREFAWVCGQYLPPALADRLGRQQWGLPVMSSPGVSLDPLASNTNAKAGRFFSKYWCTGSSGQDGYAQVWRAQAQPPHSQLAWVFPGPLTSPALAIRKIREERCDSILIIQQHWRGYWRAMLQQLPVVASAKLSYHQGLYEPGAAAPPQFRVAQHQPRVPLEALLIVFD